LLDESVPARLYRALPSHEVSSAVREGWPGVENGKLLALAAASFDAFALPAAQPRIGAKYSGSRVSGVRRLFLSRVGYFIYHRADASEPKVLAFWHGSLEPQPRL